MVKFKSQQFIWDFIQKNVIPDRYDSLRFCDYTHTTTSTYVDKNELNIVRQFPDYITPTILNESKNILYKIKQSKFNGAGIHINDNYKDMASYMSKNFKSNFRGRIKKNISRLETSFNIIYEYNYGEITKTKCNYLLDELKTMLEKRFQEKETGNFVLNNWDENVKDTFTLINQKKASLFVIYDDNKPISICLNYHIFNNLFFYYQSSYDLNYSKFSLGHINVYKFVEWSLNNDYKFIDFGNGILHYKKQWCNIFYNFEYHIIYDKNSPAVVKFYAFFEMIKIILKNLLKDLNLDIVIHKTKNILLKNKKPKQLVLHS